MGRWYTWLTRNHTSPNLARRSLAHTLKLTIEVSVHALALALLYGPLWLVAYTQLVEWYTLRVAAGGWAALVALYSRTAYCWTTTTPSGED